MNREKAIEIFKRLKENAPNEMHLETVGSAQELFDMAIQALSQEPCDDVVSRQAVLKIIDGWYEQNRDTENIEDLIVLITYMDSVRPQEQTGHWIPVSERLPDKSGDYLVTFWLGIFGSMVWKEWYDSSKSEFNVAKCDAPIIAWMPLPKPYEPQERSE